MTTITCDRCGAELSVTCYKQEIDGHDVVFCDDCNRWYWDTFIKPQDELVAASQQALRDILAQSQSVAKANRSAIRETMKKALK
jgi:transcription elongation factor Elf1